MNQTEKTVTSTDLLVKFSDGSDEALDRLREETELAFQRPIKGLAIAELKADLRECQRRGEIGNQVRQLYERASASKEFVKKAFLVWSLNYHRIGLIVEEFLGRGTTMRAACRELQIPVYTGREATKLSKLALEELRQKIEEFDPNLNLTKLSFLRSLEEEIAPSDEEQITGDGKQAEPTLGSAGPRRGNGHTTHESPPTPVAVPEGELELETLVLFLNTMWENPEYFLKARYAEKRDFLDLLQLKEDRERYRACLTVLLRVIDKQ
jgi:hypothetical protein